MSELLRKVYPYSKDEICDIRKMYSKSEEDIKCDLEILKEWLRKQAHLPQNIDDALLERFLLRNKFRIETTKQKLDLHFTAKGLHKDYLLRADPSSEEMNIMYSTINYSHLPILGNQKERICIVKFLGNDLYDFEIGIYIAFFNFEMQLRHDYATGERIILDFDGFNWAQYKTVTPFNASRALFLLKEAYSTRVIGVEVLNPPYFVDLMLQVCKMLLKPKILSRITIHKDLESLHKIVPKQCLAKEYGGDLNSLSSYYEDTKNLWIEERDTILKALRTTSNEDLRIRESKYVHKDMFGVDGTFRKIQVD